MTLQDLKSLVANGESETVEFKETTGQRGEACRTLCAFLNGMGGTVVFGVARNGKLVGQIVGDETKKDLARVFCDFEPGVEMPVESVVHNAVPGMASSPRNPSIAKVLYLRKAIEMWGRGISLIVDACKKANLPPPMIYEDRGFIYTVFTRPTAQEWKNKVGDAPSATVASVSTTDTPLSTTDKADSATNAMSAVTDGERVAHLLASFGELRSDARKSIEIALRELLVNASMTAEAIAKKTGVSSRTIQRAIMALVKAGVIKRVGPAKGGHWEVVQYEE